MMPCVLSIAGSDSGGGAGIQADVKTCAAIGCFAATVLTCLTAQNTRCVRSLWPVPSSFVAEQIDAIFEDFSVKAVKIGMLYNTSILDTVIKKLEQQRPSIIVLDPVMYAEAGGVLISESALVPMIEKLFPLATLITPNLVEVSKILKRKILSLEEMEEAAQRLLTFGPQAVLLKGGHLEKEKGSDCLCIKNQMPLWMKKEAIKTAHTHGSGCTYSTAIATYLAKGLSLEQAVRQAKEYVHGALLAGRTLELGKGNGPLHHFWRNVCVP